MRCVFKLSKKPVCRLAAPKRVLLITVMFFIIQKRRLNVQVNKAAPERILMLFISLPGNASQGAKPQGKKPWQKEINQIFFSCHHIQMLPPSLMTDLN